MFVRLMMTHCDLARKGRWRPDGGEITPVRLSPNLLAWRATERSFADVDTDRRPSGQMGTTTSAFLVSAVRQGAALPIETVREVAP